ncbi:MAG: hypothetical protein V7707_17815 [Motiliproteus sp.]
MLAINRNTPSALLLIAFACLWSLPLAAESLTPEMKAEVATTRLALAAKHRGFIARNLELEPSQNQQFWPVYDAYLEAKLGADDLRWQIILRYANAHNQGGVSEALADDLLAQGVTLLEMQLALHQQFLPRFKAVLPTVKVARFYQIVNRLNTKMEMELARNVPLVD